MSGGTHIVWGLLQRRLSQGTIASIILRYVLWLIMVVGLIMRIVRVIIHNLDIMIYKYRRANRPSE